MAGFGSLVPGFNPMQPPPMRNNSLGAQGFNILRAALAQPRPGMTGPAGAATGALPQMGNPVPDGMTPDSIGPVGPMQGGAAMPQMGLLAQLLAKMRNGMPGGMPGMAPAMPPVDPNAMAAPMPTALTNSW